MSNYRDMTDIRGLSEDNELTQKILTDFKRIVEKYIPAEFGYVRVAFDKAVFTNHIIVTFAPSNIAINNVKNQFAHKVALWLNLHDLTFEPVNLGVMGAQTIQLTPSAGSYMAYESVKIPFRKPKAALPEIYKALERFCERYVTALKDNLDRLAHKDLLSPVANQMLGLPEYTIEKDLEIAVIKSSNNDMLTFVSIALDIPHETKRILRVATKDLDKAKQFVELWYDTEAEAAKRRVNA